MCWLTTLRGMIGPSQVRESAVSQIDGDVDVAKADLHERRRGGSRVGEEDRDFESVRWGT